MYLLRIVRSDYNKKGYLQKCLEITECIALDLDFKRIVSLAIEGPCIYGEVFEISVEPSRTTSLDFHNISPTIFRFRDGWHMAYRRIKLMGGKDYGPPYPDEVWVDENHRHFLVEYQI
jgi:hypothetical protein